MSAATHKVQGSAKMQCCTWHCVQRIAAEADDSADVATLARREQALDRPPRIWYIGYIVSLAKLRRDFEPDMRQYGGEDEEEDSGSRGSARCTRSSAAFT